MINKVKKALGIEGVKVSLHVEAQSPIMRKRVKGEKVRSMNSIL